MASHPNNLKKAIEVSGRKRKWLIAQLGVSRMTLHRWEHGESRVPDSFQDAVADLLPEFEGPIFPKEEMFDAV